MPLIHATGLTIFTLTDPVSSNNLPDGSADHSPPLTSADFDAWSQGGIIMPPKRTGGAKGVSDNTHANYAILDVRRRLRATQYDWKAYRSGVRSWMEKGFMEKVQRKLKLNKDEWPTWSDLPANYQAEFCSFVRAKWIVFERCYNDWGAIYLGITYFSNKKHNQLKRARRAAALIGDDNVGTSTASTPQPQLARGQSGNSSAQAPRANNPRRSTQSAANSSPNPQAAATVLPHDQTRPRPQPVSDSTQAPEREATPQPTSLPSDNEPASDPQGTPSGPGPVVREGEVSTNPVGPSGRFEQVFSDLVAVWLANQASPQVWSADRDPS